MKYSDSNTLKKYQWTESWLGGWICLPSSLSPSPQQLLLPLFGCGNVLERDFLGTRMDFPGVWHWWSLQGSAIPPLLHPNPKNPKFSRGKFLSVWKFSPPAAKQTIPGFQPFQSGQGKPWMRFGESKPEGSRRNSRGVSAFPLLPQCLEQQILLSCALGLIKKTPNVWPCWEKNWILGAKAPKNQHLLLSEQADFVFWRIHHIPVSLKGFCPSL